MVLWDPGYRGVLPAGSHGVDKELLNRIEGTLDETPIAERALREDRVIVSRGPLRGHVPDRYAEIVPESTFICAPIQAAGEWFGVIFADRDTADFELSSEERELIGTLARLAALAFSVERGTRQRERARRLSERVALTRDVHEQVIQRLFATSLALGVEGPLSVEERERCEREVRLAIGELRSALSRPAPDRTPKSTLRQLLDRLGRSDPVIEVRWETGVEVGEEIERTAQAVVSEAVANARKHADPKAIVVAVTSTEEALVVEVTNDGVGEGIPEPGTGLGLRLVAFEALDRRGVVEYGPLEAGRWHVRLVVPRAGGRP